MNIVLPHKPAHDCHMIKDWHGVCARARPYSIDKSNGRALSGGPAPFTSPPGAVGAWPSHAIATRDSFGAGCLTISQDHRSQQEPRPGATRLEVGPRETRAGSRVPRHTSSSPAVQATCQGGAVHAPGASPRGGPLHAPVEAPCSALADDTAEERLCPYTYGSAMLRAGDKQLGVAPGPHQPQGAQGSVSSLIVMPPHGSAAQGGWARGLRLGHAQTHAAQPGPLRAWFVTCLSPSGAKVRRPFERQGGLLSIATQEPNWSPILSLLGPSRSPVGPMAVEVCAGPGSADAEHKADRKKIAKSRSKYYKTYCSPRYQTQV